MWGAAVDLSAAKEFRFKYVVTGAPGHLRWEV